MSGRRKGLRSGSGGLRLPLLDQGVSRRGFLKTASVGAASLYLTLAIRQSIIRPLELIQTAASHQRAAARRARATGSSRRRSRRRPLAAAPTTCGGAIPGSAVRSISSPLCR